MSPRHLEGLDVIIQSTPPSPDERKQIDEWLPGPSIELASVKVRWAPGRAVLEGSAEACEKLLPVLVEFSSLEAQLTSLEQALQAYGKSAPEDVNYAYVVQGSDRAQWPRIQETMRSLARIRLSLANLDIGNSPKKLQKIAKIPARLESLDTRLEAYEDLYEGAVDRIADFRWYRHGELLEIAILVLLALEVAVTVWFKS